MAGSQPSEPAGAGRNDPLPVFCFKIVISDMGGEAFFKSVGGLKYEMEPVPVREGGQNATTYQLLGPTKWSNIVLKRGFTKDSRLIAWREEWLAGPGTRAETGTITLLDTALNPKAEWTFFRGMPVKWEITEFDASKSELAIETLEIAHEGISYKGIG
jgi:phage tail-like protein